MIYLHPGTYTLSSGITLPNGITIGGTTRKHTFINLNVTTSADMITIGENCIIENVTLNLTCTGSNDNLTLRGIVFGGTTSLTSSVEHSLINVTNSTMARTLTSNVYAIESNGTGTLTIYNYIYNNIKSCIINVNSNGLGKKRGILVSNTNQTSSHDTNIYINSPSDTLSTGSYVGVETNDISNVGTCVLYTTTVGATEPGVGGLFTASDILQTTPATPTPANILASGIKIDSATYLVNKTAGSKGFTILSYPQVIYYGLKGTVHTGTSGGYLWAGTQKVSNDFPDPTSPPAYFRIQQPAIIFGLFASLNRAPGGTDTVTLQMRYTPNGGVLTTTPFTVVFTGTDKLKSYYASSLSVKTGDYIHLQVSYTGGNGNLADDLTAQIDFY